MGAVSQSVARAAERFGAKIRVGADVVKILCDNQRAYGVVLADGQELRSKIVVSNADPKRTFLELVQADHRTADIRSAVERLDTECGTMKLHTVVDELPDFSRHLGVGFDPRSLVMIRICPSTQYYRKSVEDASAGRVSSNPIFDIQIPTVYDTSIAPPGKHIVSMWIRYEPVHPKGSTWDELRQGEGERLIDMFTEYAPNFRKSVRDWLLLTPLDIERRLNITDGNYHHTNHSPGQLLGDRLFQRGGYRSPIAGLYMCGAGTHPGGEVSGAPGHNAAHAILADLQSGESARRSRPPVVAGQV
jgi:phytoene dehydrogenase-like protein